MANKCELSYFPVYHSYIFTTYKIPESSQYVFGLYHFHQRSHDILVYSKKNFYSIKIVSVLKSHLLFLHCLEKLMIN